VLHTTVASAAAEALPPLCGNSTLISGATSLMKINDIMHNHLIGPLHYALHSQQCNFPCIELVPTQIPCITRAM
jgi:hypothetical protein